MELKHLSTSSELDPKDCKVTVDKLAKIGSDALGFIEKGDMDGNGNSILSKEQVNSVCKKVDKAKTKDDVQSLKQEAEMMEQGFEYSTIAKAQEAFGELKGCIGDKHPHAPIIAEV